MFTDTRSFTEVLNNPMGLSTEDAESMIAVLILNFSDSDIQRMAEEARCNLESTDS